MPTADGVLVLTEGMHHCPGHRDRRASLSVRRAPDGRWLLHDFGGCDTEVILRAAGLSFADLFPSDSSRPTRPTRRPHWRDELERPLLARARRATARLAHFREVFAMSDQIRERRQAIDQLRRLVSSWGDVEDVWPVLDLLAEESRDVDALEAEVDLMLAEIRR